MATIDFTTLDRATIAAKIVKYMNQGILLIDYIPILGPLFNASHAINLVLSLWSGSSFSSRSSSSSSSSPESVMNSTDCHSTTTTVNESYLMNEKSRMIRVKGLTAVATALIDIFTLCLTIGVIAYLCDCLERIQTFIFVRQILILAIMVSVFTFSIGSKIITAQLVEHLTVQLEEVNSASTSVVKSVTITATAIERIVETTNSKTGAFVTKMTTIWERITRFLVLLFTFPLIIVRSVRANLRRQMAIYCQSISAVWNKLNATLRTILNAYLFLLPACYRTKVIKDD